MPMTQAQRDANNYASLLGMPLPYDASGNPSGGSAANQTAAPAPAAPSNGAAYNADGSAAAGYTFKPGVGYVKDASAPTAAAQVNANQASPATASPAMGGPSVGEANQLNEQPTQTMSQDSNSVSGSTGDQFFLNGQDQSGFDPSMLPSNAGQTGYNGGSGTLTGGGGSPTIYQQGGTSGSSGTGQMQNPQQSATGSKGGGFGSIGANGTTPQNYTSITPRNSGINTSGAATAYINDTNAAYKAAQQANQQMYNTVNGEFNQNKADLSGGYAQMLGLTQNLGASETAQNQQLTQQQTSDATQRAISQGLGNTTVLSGMQQGAQNQGQLRQLGINNQVAQQQLGVLNTSISGMQQNSLNQAGFQERVSNPYPNTSGYLQAIQMGGSGSGGFYGK